MERRIEFTPAMDQNRDVGHQGISPVGIRFIVAGAEGAVQFELLTGWYHRPTTERVHAEILNDNDTQAALNTFAPCPGEVAVYSRTERNTELELRLTCENPLDEPVVWQQGICHLDGQKLFEDLLWLGHDGIFEKLETEYQKHFS